MNNAGIADDRMRLLFSLIILGHNNLFIKAILTAVRLIRHNDNVSALRKCLLTAFKLEHGCEDNSIRTSAIKQCLQMLLALRLNRRLTKEVRTLGELCIQLIIQIDTVRHNHDRRAVQCLLQKMCIKHHRQRLAGPLRMPEYTALSVGLRRDLRLLNCLMNREILMVGSQYLKSAVAHAGEQNEIFQDIQKPRLLEHPLIEGFKGRIARVFIISILRLPFHETIQAGSDCPGSIGRQITDHADRIVIEDGRNILHIVADLMEGILCPHLILRRTLQLHQNKRQAIDEQNDVRTAVISIFKISKLINHIERVVSFVHVIDQTNNRRLLLSLHKELYRDAILQVIHEGNVFLQETSRVEIPKLSQCLIDRFHRQPTINTHKTVSQLSIQQRTAVVPIQIRRVEVIIAHIFEQFYDGLFVCIFCK